MGAARISLGNTINLGFPEPLFYSKKNFLRSESDEMQDFQASNSTCLLLLEEIFAQTRFTFYVNKNSMWLNILNTWQDDFEKFNIHYFEYDELHNIWFRDDSYVFLDCDEYKIYGEHLEKGLTLPPFTIITTNTLYFLYKQYENVKKIASFIDRLYLTNDKKFIILADSFYEYIFSGLLRLFSHKIHAIFHSNYRRIFRHSLNSCYVDIHSIQDIDPEYFAFFLFENKATELQYVMLNNLQCDYYFLCGEKKKQDNSYLTKRYIVHAFPHAGTGRIKPVIDMVLASLSSPPEVAIDHFSLYRMSQNQDGFRADTTDYHYTYQERVKQVVSLLQPCRLFLHQPYYDLMDACAAKDCMTIIFMRDTRDLLVSQINWFFGLLINNSHGSKSFEDYFFEFCEAREAKHRLYVAHQPLSVLTKNLVAMVNNEHYHFIRFEDVHEDPFKAYMELFQKTQLVTHPLWNMRTLVPQIKQLSHHLVPEYAKTSQEDAQNQRPSQRLLHGKAGAWKKYFTPKMKTYFKENSHNILEVFGYEKDDKW